VQPLTRLGFCPGFQKFGEPRYLRVVQWLARSAYEPLDNGRATHRERLRLIGASPLEVELRKPRDMPGQGHVILRQTRYVCVNGLLAPEVSVLVVIQDGVDIGKIVKRIAELVRIYTFRSVSHGDQLFMQRDRVLPAP
jgi:hypothetical protein